MLFPSKGASGYYSNEHKNEDSRGPLGHWGKITGKKKSKGEFLVPKAQLQSIFFLVLFLGSCTGSPPEIIELSGGIFWDGRSESLIPTHLAIEVLAIERNGIGDIESVEVSHRGRELSWLIPIGDLSIEEGPRGLTLLLPLLGYETLGTEEPTPLPLGNYEVKVTDLGGAQALGTFFLSPELPPERRVRFEGNFPWDFSLYTTSRQSEWIYGAPTLSTGE